MTDRRRFWDDEDGSILPLILGYTLIAIAVLFVCVCATDLYIAQKRLDATADAAALAGADGFTLEAEGESVRAELTDAGVRDQAGSRPSACCPACSACSSARAWSSASLALRVLPAREGMWHRPHR